MKHQLYVMILAVAILAEASSASAGNGLFFLKRVGTFIDTMSVSGVDRRYIDAPEKPWQLILRGNVNQSSVKMSTESRINDYYYSAQPKMKTEPSQYLGFWAGYRGYGLGYTVNVGGDKGSYLTFGASGGAYGVNVRIHSFKNNEPSIVLNDNYLPEEQAELSGEVDLVDPIRVHTLIANAYYLFNGRRFSYAAAYDQSVLQKRSVGSLMVGLMYYYGRIDYASNPNADLINVMNGLGKVKLWQSSVGGGYAYNWVPTKRLLVNVMAMPLLTFVNKVKAYGYSTNVDELAHMPSFTGNEMSNDEWYDWWYDNLRIEPMGQETFNSGLTVNFDSRLSITYTFGRFFVNAYGQFNNFRYSHNNSHGRLNDWFVNTSIGVRL